MAQAKLILTKLLVGFALISIGFALGKRSMRNTDNSNTPIPASQNAYIAVYYMHSTFRCSTCNTIEKMTKELLDHSYSKSLADGRIRWQEVDFQVNEALAEKFKVAASCVVVAKFDNGRIIDFQRLDKVWTLMKSPALFNEYISNAIDAYLKQPGG